MRCPIPHWLALGLCAPLIAQDDPCTYVFDTGARAALALPAEAIEHRSGWRLVPEGNVAHAFKGDAAFLNDRIAVVLRRRGRGAEVYARTSHGQRPRAVLLASGAVRVSSLKLVQNGLSAVGFDTVLSAGDGATAAVRFRITAGQPIVEITPGHGMGELVVRAKSRYTVVPDFFGDDVVFDARALRAGRVGLPAESLLVHLIDGADAMLMCVWQARNQRAYLVPGVGSAIQCAQGKSIWLALMEREHIWTDDASAWKPPFPAKRRISVMGEDCAAESGELTEERLASGRAAIVYPIDRSRTTPLDVFCPTDVMRNTLGCGPCQYLLEREGFDAAAHPTPADVTKWVERQFKRKRAKRSADQIEERLGLMAEHVRHVQARLARYEALAKEVQALCVDPRNEKMRGLAEQMAQEMAAHRNAMKSTPRADELGGRVAALIGKANALAECQALSEQIRAIGAAQDRALSKCRMTVRRIKVLCLDAPRGDGRDMPERVLKLIEQILKSKGQTP